MNIKSKYNPQNHLTFTEAFNKIERKTTDKFEQNLDSYIKDADSTLDNIYVYNTLFNPIYTLKYLHNKKFIKTFMNKKKNQNVNSHTSLNEVKKDKINNIKKSKLKPNSRNRTLNFLGKFNSYDAIRNANKNKNKNVSNQINNIINKNNDNINMDNKTSENNSKEKSVKFNCNTINNFNRNINSNKIPNIKLDKAKIPSNTKFNNIKNSINDINMDKNNNEFITIQINKDDSPKESSKEDEKILKALHRNKFHLLKFQKKKFIKEMKKEKAIKIIDEDIESKENSLFQNEEKNQLKPDLLNNNSDNNKNTNNIMRFSKTEKNLFNNKIDNKIKQMILSNTLNIKNENENKNKNKTEQKSLEKKIINKNNSETKIKNIENYKNDSNIHNNSNISNSNIKEKDENENSLNNNKKKEDNLKSSSYNKKLSSNKSMNNIKKLAKINYSIYLDCVKNIKQNQNFPDILKYVGKQRLFQYKINNLKNKIKSEEDILYPNKQLLKNQDKEVYFHKQELMKRTEKENLYNNFKKQLSERYIHKNLTIDAISKISTKLAFYGRRYFIKNYNYDFIGDKDFLFKNEMLLNMGQKHHNKERYYKVKDSCENVIYNINKLAKNKMRIMKRLNDDKEKYNNKKNGYFFVTDDADKNKNKHKHKDLDTKTMPLSRNENENNYTNNYSYDEFTNKNTKEINEILLPKVAFIKHGMSFDEF